MRMAMYEIQIDGKTRKVELTKVTEKSFTAKIDNRPLNVEFAASKLELEKPFSVTVNGKTYHVELPKIDREKAFAVKVEEASFTAEFRTGNAKTTLTTFEPTPSAPTRKAVNQKLATEGSVTAPMTGKIVSVKVKKNYQVKTGQLLCVIEAMKMENEICSPKNGTIQEVNVSEGSPVNEGDVLFVIG